MHSEEKPHPTDPHMATGLHGGQQGSTSPPLQLLLSLARPPLPLHLPNFPGFCPCGCQHLWLLLCHHLETSLHLDIKSSLFWESTWWLCPDQLYKYSSACKWMALTGDKAKSSWKCKMALTQPQMLWLAGIEVGKSLI